MSGLRILLTNNTLDKRYGSELYVRDLALALLARGHTPIAFSTVLGEVAHEMRRATIPVIDDLAALGSAPDIIHGQHHLETMMALLHFTETPAISFCHGWAPWEEEPPAHPRILRYLAVDYVCKDRLICEHSIAESRTQVLLNFVDLDRFKQRPSLPSRPERALVFSNYANEQNGLAVIRQSCAEAGIELDVIGENAGNICSKPEEILGQYDLVFARGRSALEALATGASVILLGSDQLGPLVTMAELDRLRHLNFGTRALRSPLNSESLRREIARYDSTDAAAVTTHIRATASREEVADELIEIYRAVIAEHASKNKVDSAVELHATAAYLRQLAPRLKALDEYHNDLERSRGYYKHERDNYKRELDWIKNSTLFRLRERLVRLPLFTRFWRALLKNTNV